MSSPRPPTAVEPQQLRFLRQARLISEHPCPMELCQVSPQHIPSTPLQACCPGADPALAQRLYQAASGALRCLSKPWSTTPTDKLLSITRAASTAWAPRH